MSKIGYFGSSLKLLWNNYRVSTRLYFFHLLEALPHFFAPTFWKPVFLRFCERHFKHLCKTKIGQFQVLIKIQASKSVKRFTLGAHPLSELGMRDSRNLFYHRANFYAIICWIDQSLFYALALFIVLVRRWLCSLKHLNSKMHSKSLICFAIVNFFWRFANKKSALIFRTFRFWFLAPSFCQPQKAQLNS